MSRYQPTPEEQVAIELLEGRGFKVLREATYINQRQRIRDLEWQVIQEVRNAQHSSKYSAKAWDEVRRLSDRLTEVVMAAAAQGVDIGAINQILAKARDLTVGEIMEQHWLKFADGQITGCQCGFVASPDDSGFGDSVVAHLLRITL